MFGCAPYGCVLYGGLIDYEDTHFPLAVFMHESSVYSLVLELQNEYTLSLYEA